MVSVGASHGPPAGVAWRAVAGPVGADFAGVELEAVAVAAPRAGAWAATVVHRRRFMEGEGPEARLGALEARPGGVAQEEGDRPVVVQASREGVTAGAQRPVTDFSEVMLAADPSDDLHLLGGSKFFHTPAGYGFFTGVFESFDGGLSWTQEQPGGVEDYRLTSDPVNCFDGEGTGYFTLLTRNPGGYSGLDMLRKAKGEDWERPVTVDDSTVTDKQWIVADQDPLERSPHTGNVYMSWTDVGQERGIVFARSSDGNATWSPPVVVERGGLQGSIPGVGPDGTVYVLYGKDIFGGNQGQMRLATSVDGGVSFEEPTTVATIRPIPFFLPNGLDDRNFRSPASLPAFAVSPLDGTLYAAWADYRHGDSDIYLTQSGDGGASWTTATRMNDDPVGNGVDQLQPQLSVSPQGRVALLWLDRRLPCPEADWVAEEHRGRENFCLDAFMTRSYDAGATWVPNLRVGRAAFDWSVNLPVVSTDRNGFRTGFIGDYIGVASTREADVAFWPATSDLGDNPQHRQQIFAAIVTAGQYDPPASPTPVAVTSTPTVEPTETVVPSATPTAEPTAAPVPPLYLPRTLVGE
jgi:hypothetical protein